MLIEPHSPFMTVRKVAALARRVVGDYVQDKILIAVVINLMGFTRLEQKRVAGSDFGFPYPASICFHRATIPAFAKSLFYALATFGTVPRCHGNAQLGIQFLKQFQRVIVLVIIDDPSLRPDFLIGCIIVFQKRLNAVFLQQRLIHSHATLICIRVNSLHRLSFLRNA